jgi:hypothetical protein
MGVVVGAVVLGAVDGAGVGLGCFLACIKASKSIGPSKLAVFFAAWMRFVERFISQEGKREQGKV